LPAQAEYNKTMTLDFINIIPLALIAELVDSSLGMMYGTLLSPLLIIMGFEPIDVVPAILFSQALGGGVATIFHQYYKNADFKPATLNPRRIKNGLKRYGWIGAFRRGFNHDFKIAFTISVLGVLATIFAAVIAINVSKNFLRTYIAVLVVIMGLLLFKRKKFLFSWKKITALSIVSAFNKGLSGGGFGPVVTAGQVIAGNEPKSSVAVTTLAEVAICLTGFATYWWLGKFDAWPLLIVLTIGAVAGAPAGAFLTSKINEQKLRPLLAVVTTLLGLGMLFLKAS